MSVMIVGADHLGNIEKNLQYYGITDIKHIHGRNVADRKRFSIPPSISLVVVFIDYVNHMTARNVKEQAKAQGVPMLFSQRSWCSLEEQLVKRGMGRKAVC